MPSHQNEDLPSIEDFLNKNEQLVSISECISESNDLPSISDFIGGKIEDCVENNEEVLIENYNFEVENINDKNLVEVLRLINDVKDSIPSIPEVKYYDEELTIIDEKLEILKNYVSNLPEVKYYDEQLSRLNHKIDEVKETIPSFPSWINEVNEVPDFSWIGKTFSVIDDDFIKVNDNISNLKINFDQQIDSLIETLDLKEFQINVDVKLLNQNLKEAKDKIYSELKESAITIWKLKKEFKEDNNLLQNEIKKQYVVLQSTINECIDELNSNLNLEISELKDYFKNLSNEIENLPEVKYYDSEIESLKTNIKENSLDIKELKNIASLIKEQQNQLKNELKEGLLNIPPNVDNSDPLTPLNQNFATLDDLANHYKIFINRIQTQLSAIGGGGAGYVKDLSDVDITGITTGSILKWNPSNNKWIIGSISSGGSGVDGTWNTNSIGVSTTKNVGIGTTSANQNYSLYVNGDSFFTGNVSVAGTITYEDVTNIDSIGFVTARSGLLVGSATTFSEKFVVEGDARVTGILTVGRSSITIDGDNNKISIGNENVVINNSSITIGSGVSISAFSSGINTAPNVLYVAKDGNDLNNGSSIDNAFLTIKSAVGVATTGTIIKVLAGSYVEDNPIEVPPFVSIVGNDLKTVTVSPQNPTSDIFHVRKGCYIANMTFVGHVYPSAAISFPTNSIAVNEGGGKWESPYIQNCTSNTTTGTGLRIDGNQAEGLKSMVCDSYTQYNQGGVGVAVTNEGFAQLVSVFTICCNEAITCYKGGQVDLTNSNSSFGTYGLVSDGVSNLQYTGVVTSTANSNQNIVSVALTSGIKPYDGQVVYFDKLYKSVTSIRVSAGGTGYTSTPSVTIDSPTGPNGQTALAFATLNGDSVSEITIISSGNQYESVPNVTISSPNIGSNSASAVAEISPIYYTINSSTPINSGISTVTLDENLINTVSVGTTVYFQQVSKIVASSHTFSYVGSGNDIASAIPQNGGVTIQENEVVGRNGGKVVYTSTDQSGNFRIGDGFQINQNTGTISGRSFTRSLFSEMTPFILALS